VGIAVFLWCAHRAERGCLSIEVAGDGFGVNALVPGRMAQAHRKAQRDERLLIQKCLETMHIRLLPGSWTPLS